MMNVCGFSLSIPEVGSGGSKFRQSAIVCAAIAFAPWRQFTYSFVEMSNAHLLPRNLIIFGIVLPLAAFIGYLLATPEKITSMAIVGLVIGVLTIPFFLRWHHPLLILTWNAAMNAFFLPGRPSVWMVVAGISFGITVLGCILNKEQKFQHYPAMTWSVLFLLGVVLITAKMTGGIGLRSMGGSSYGGKGYVFIIAGILGYFALSSTRIPPQRAQLYAALFFLSGLTFVISNLAYMGGPSLWFLFYAFPVEFALSQAVADFTGDSMTRLAGLGFAAMAVCNFLMLRYGVRGLLDLRQSGRAVLFISALGISFLGGFRSALVIIALTFLIQFCVEKLHRTRLLPGLLVAGVLAFALLIPFSSKLPLSMQRVLTVVPFLEVDPIAKANAEASIEWRLEMWRLLLPEVENHFWIGKGYAVNPTDLYLVEQSIRRGLAGGHEGAAAAGDYHSGPLSLIIPFGIFGVIAFLCVLWAGARVLYQNWKFGDPALKNINTILFSMYLMRVLFYFVFFGSFYTDLMIFLGFVGLSLSINHGVRKAAEIPVMEVAPPRPMIVRAQLPAHA